MVDESQNLETGSAKIKGFSSAYNVKSNFFAIL